MSYLYTHTYKWGKKAIANKNMHSEFFRNEMDASLIISSSGKL